MVGRMAAPKKQFPCDQCEFVSESPQGLGAHRRRHKQTAKRNGPDEVLKQLFPNGVPVEKLDQVSAWRRATTKMLS